MKQLLYKYYPEFTGLIVFSIYLNTMCPTILGMDSGELAAVQATLSIAHPSGYPLFAWVGYLFLKLPLPFEPIIRLNILAAIWCALTIVILIRTSKIIIENLDRISSPKWHNIFKNVKGYKYLVFLGSTFPGLMLAFSLTFWSQSTHVEVYSFQMFLVSMIIYLSIAAYINKEELNNSSFRQWYKKRWLWVFILIGFAFANHLTTVFLILPTIILIFYINEFNIKCIKNLILLFFLSFIVAAIFYLWMMFRASSNPPFKYGDPSNVQRLFEHIIGKRYIQNVLNHNSPFKIQLIKLIESLQFDLSNNKWGEFSFSIFIGIAGIIFSWLTSRRMFLYLFSIIIITLLISLNYYIFDIYEYFLPAFYILSLLSGLSIVYIGIVIPRKYIFVGIFTIFLLFLIITQFYSNYKYADESKERSYEDFALKYIESLPPNAVLYTDNWDRILSPILYLQNVRGIRRDVIIFSPWRRICFTPYQTTNIKRFFRDGELILDKKIFIYGKLNENSVELVE